MSEFAGSVETDADNTNEALIAMALGVIEEIVGLQELIESLENHVNWPRGVSDPVSHAAGAAPRPRG